MDRLFVQEQLFGRLGWLIRIRWAFLAGLMITVAACRIYRIDLPYSRILAVGGFILIYNLALWFRHFLASRKGNSNISSGRIEANLQIGADYLSLTFLIHYSGGVENPFIFLYLLHIIIGSIILTRPQVWFEGVAAFFLFLSVVILEYAELIPHYRIPQLYSDPRFQNPYFIVAVSLTLVATLLSTIYMSTSIVRSLRAREYELMQTRSMLEKKSTDLANANRDLREKQQQLLQSETLASLGRLSAGMAHEINNPIQFIQGNMRILNEAMDSILPVLDRNADANPDFKVARLDYPFFREHIKVLLNDMCTGTVRIADIVRDLKKFARAEEGRFDETVDVNEAVESSLRLVHNKIKRHTVVPELDPGLPKIKGNVSKIEQVMVANLINAAEALIERSEGSITVKTSADPGGASVNVSITDNGPGMTEEVRRKLFDPFFTTKHRSGGMGLGLSVAYGIIKDHQGWIDVETRLGEGTTFHYHFPVVRSEG